MKIVKIYWYSDKEAHRESTATKYRQVKYKLVKYSKNGKPYTRCCPLPIFQIGYRQLRPFKLVGIEIL